LVLPMSLTECESKIFHSMVMETGKSNFESLLKVAEKVSGRLD